MNHGIKYTEQIAFFFARFENGAFKTNEAWVIAFEMGMQCVLTINSRLRGGFITENTPVIKDDMILILEEYQIALMNGDTVCMYSHIKC